MTRMLLYSVVDRREAGGAQAVIARLLDGLRDRGHEVLDAWAGPGRGGRIGTPSPGAGWICPLHVRPPGPGTGGRSVHLPSLLRLALGLARRRPEIVNIHFISEQALYFLLLRRVFGYRVVLSAHGSDVMAPDPRWREYLPRFLGAADAVTVVSAPLAERVLAVPGVDAGKVHLIPNGIDTDFWTPAAPSPLAPFPAIVAVGRLEPVKGFDVLLEAFARVHAAVPDAKLCLIGEGSQRRVLAAQAERLGIGPAVEFTGQLGKEAIRERLRAAAAYALPSRSEGMPLALLEAMACGIPPVAARVGGVPDVVTPGTGLLVAPEDPAGLSDALLRVLCDRVPAVVMGEAAARRARDFSSHAAEEAFDRLYRSLTTPATHRH